MMMDGEADTLSNYLYRYHLHVAVHTCPIYLFIIGGSWKTVLDEGGPELACFSELRLKERRVISIAMVDH